MTRHDWITTFIALLLGASLPLSAARADLEVTGPDGRRIVLKDDGTWRYVDAAAQDVATEKTKEAGEAILKLVRRIEEGPNCRFEFNMVNNLPYEILHIVPAFEAYRADGVRYDIQSVDFYSLKPGNTQDKSVLFQLITCPEIARLKVVGGDRCSMGELDRFSPEKGICLERVRVVPSDLLPFEK